jgi:hypothetical protein
LAELFKARFLVATFFVSLTGNDENAGTSIDAPMRTIQNAVNVAQPGDTIMVRGGTYRETVTTSRSGTAEAPITIRNYEKEEVVVSGTDVIAGEWEPLGKGVYRADMPWNYQFENQSKEYDSN